MTITTKAALIGAGFVAQHGHIPAIKKDPSSRIMVVVDPVPAARAEAEKLVPGVLTCSSLEELPLSDINCAVICSPSALHYEHVKFFLNKNISVLSEKPLATKASEAQELAVMVKTKNLVLQVGYNRRYQPVARYLKETIETGTYGPLVSVTVRAGSIARDLPSAILNPALSGGGVLMDYGVHFIDRLCSWFDELDVVSYRDDSEGGLEVNAHLLLKASNRWCKHIPVNVYLSWTSEMGDSFTLEFHNVTLKCTINNGRQFSMLTHKKQTTSLKNIYANKLVDLADAGNIMDLQWNEFKQRLSGGVEMISSLEDAVRVNKIVESCYTQRNKLQLTYGY